MRWLGVDPGGRETGIIVRDGDELIAHRVIVREGDAPMPVAGDPYWPRYLHTVRLAVAGWGKDAMVAVESLEDWSGGDSRRRNIRGLMGTAMVLGTVLVVRPDAVPVRPGGGHGGLDPWVYPEPIRQARHAKGKDQLRHCRSGWDISHAGETLHNQMTRRQEQR